MSDRITLSLLLYTCWGTFLLSVVIGYCLRISWPLWFFFSPHEICTRKQQQQSCFWGISHVLLQYSISCGGKSWGSFIVILNDLLALHWYFARQYVAAARDSLLHDFLTIKPDQRIKGIPYTAYMIVFLPLKEVDFVRTSLYESILCASAWLIVYVIFVSPHSWNVSTRKSIQAFKHQEVSGCFFSHCGLIFHCIIKSCTSMKQHNHC